MTGWLVFWLGVIFTVDRALNVKNESICIFQTTPTIVISHTVTFFCLFFFFLFFSLSSFLNTDCGADEHAQARTVFHHLDSVTFI